MRTRSAALEAEAVGPAVVVIDGLSAVAGVQLWLAGVRVGVFRLAVDVAFGVRFIFPPHLCGVGFEPGADSAVQPHGDVR